MNWKPIDGRILSAADVEIAIKAAEFKNFRPSGGALHNTAVPSLKRSKDYPIEHWRSMWEGYYRGLGWSAGPHYFCFPGPKVLAFTPIILPGVHSPSWNGTKFGVEMVADFDTEDPASGDGLQVVQGAVAVFAALYAKLGLDPTGIKLHKEDPRTTHACPGKLLDKHAFIEMVQERMGEAGEHPLAKEEPVATTPAKAFPKGTVTVAAGDTLNMRVSADGKSAVVLQLGPGAAVEIRGEAMNGSTKWLRVSAQGQQGWVSARYVTT